MSYSFISIVIPVRNESDRLIGTIKSIMENSVTACEKEFIIVDDASDDPFYEKMVDEVSEVCVKVFRLNEHVGIPRARNYGVSMAQGDIVFITDAHVHFSKGWDSFVLNNIEDNKIIAATICDPKSNFKGYGSHLVVPFVGIRWNQKLDVDRSPFVQIASSAGTVLTKKLFERIGGYDQGMMIYGGDEPEFSIRAWLSGAEIVSAPSLQVNHRFKTIEEVSTFLKGLGANLIHNNLRFGLLYLSEPACLQMIRYFAMLYPKRIQEAVKLLQKSDVWDRRAQLNESLIYDFKWFVRHFKVKDQINQEIFF
ncbi:glycosyltransferase [Chengkuizengella sediminis]|uniref:glycosyltransferase n=1 Tax=Chengkuizengella sediminis TaxID=1885917 RepID=UPI00138A5BAD|nr:glycosyltransferase [Chengkuizengella sediminis]NDI35766.1 glycosyltransferase [Chengkuizengella sediminis]